MLLILNGSPEPPWPTHRSSRISVISRRSLNKRSVRFRLCVIRCESLSSAEIILWHPTEAQYRKVQGIGVILPLSVIKDLVAPDYTFALVTSVGSRQAFAVIPPSESITSSRTIWKRWPTRPRPSVSQNGKTTGCENLLPSGNLG